MHLFNRHVWECVSLCFVFCSNKHAHTAHECNVNVLACLGARMQSANDNNGGNSLANGHEGAFVEFHVLQQQHNINNTQIDQQQFTWTRCGCVMLYTRLRARADVESCAHVDEHHPAIYIQTYQMRCTACSYALRLQIRPARVDRQWNICLTIAPF